MKQQIVQCPQCGAKVPTRPAKSKPKESPKARSEKPQPKSIPKTLEPYWSIYQGVVEKWRIVRHYTTQVISGREHGFLIYGPGGTGKSFAILDELRMREADYKLHNSRLSARKLVDLFIQHPNSVHFVEDAEKVLDPSDKSMIGVLRSATWGQKRNGRIERIVKWETAGTSIEVEFKGGVIIASNAPITASPELEALASRMTPMELTLSNEEIQAVMMVFARSGFDSDGSKMTSRECTSVARLLIKEMNQHEVRYNLRLLEHAYRDFLCHRDKYTSIHWHRLVAVRVSEQAALSKHANLTSRTTGSRRVRTQDDLDVVRQIVSETDDAQQQFQIFRERTGGSRATFFRRKSEAEKE